MTRLKTHILVAFILLLILGWVAYYRFNNPQQTPQSQAVMELNELSRQIMQAQHQGDEAEADRIQKEIDQILNQHPKIKAEVERINQQVQLATPVIEQARKERDAGNYEQSIRLYEQAIDQLPEELDGSLKLELAKERVLVKNRLAQQQQQQRDTD